MPIQEFEAQIEAEGEGGAWPIIRIPFSVEQAFGSRARLPVVVTLNGHTFRTSACPSGGGAHVVMVNKQMRTAVGVGVGDRVKVTMDRDATPREVDIPDDLRLALAAGGCLAAFEKLAYSARKLHVDAVEGAKKQETRVSRIEKIVSTLSGQSGANG